VEASVVFSTEHSHSLQLQASEVSSSRETVTSEFSKACCSVARREALNTSPAMSKEHSKVKRILV